MDSLEKNRFDRMEEHIKQLQKSVEQVLTAITGNTLNGNRGIVKDITEIRQIQTELDGRLKKIEDKENETSIYINMLKFGVGVLVVALTGAIVALIFKK